MTQRNRTKVEVETLEDRITPAAIGCYGSKLYALKSTLYAKIGNLQSQINTQLASLKSKINALNGGSNGYVNGSSNGNAHVHSKICTALDAAYAKLVKIGAPQSVLNKVISLQAKFGCNNVA